MYLKELTLKGFKSFASATTMRFEPGITAVVGPNGSGKSNIVDALTWVMGEQGAKNLRGTSMEDVIFAGTVSRPALGRAQVSLTIDNTDRMLDIDYTEVTISRTIFRNGGSEYAINGTPCRLLDIQELLSDTGLGAQMHVIVGQGRLDQILHATPAGHRAFIEEAAGILKHRKRKERALRKLASTEANLARLDDLLGEIRRQMKPLGRQARISRKADLIQATLRDAQARLLADDATQTAGRQTRNRAELTRIRRELRESQRALADVNLHIERIEAETRDSNPAMARLNTVWHDMGQIQERLRSLAMLADERQRSLTGQITPLADDPEPMLNRADELDHQAQEQRGIVEGTKQRFDNATAARIDAENRLAAVRGTAAELRSSAQRQEARLAKLRELIAREEATVQSIDTQKTEQTEQLRSLSLQLDEAKADKDRQQRMLHDDDHQPSDDRLTQAKAALEQARNEASDIEARKQKTDTAIVSLQAKADALADTLESRGSSQATKAITERSLGNLVDFLHVDDGWEDAVSHTLGTFANAVIVRDGDTMLRALETIEHDRTGRAVLIRTDVEEPSSMSPATPSGRSLADLLSPNNGANINNSADGHNSADDTVAQAVVNAVRRLVADTAAVRTRQQAIDAIDAGWHRAVTIGGELFVAGVAASGGRTSAHSDLSLAARRDKALAQIASLREEQRNLAEALAEAQRKSGMAGERVQREQTALNERRMAVRQLETAIVAAQQRIDDIVTRQTATRNRMQMLIDNSAARRRTLDELHRSWEAESRQDDNQADADELATRERELETTLTTLREAETDARMQWSEATHRLQSYERQADLLRGNAKQAEERRVRVEELNRRRREQADHAARIAAMARTAAARLGERIGAVERERDDVQRTIAAHDGELARLRARRDELAPTVSTLRVHEHELDLERERLAAEHGQTAQKIRDVLGMGVDDVIREYGPDVPVPLPGDDPDGETRTEPYSRETQTRRLERARRDLAKLGRVNPLATEEFEALEARNRYLNDQRDDVITSRDDLMALIRRLDATMVDVFRKAFDDTAAAFERMFAILFPGGQGTLKLENPDDLLTTGVLVQARPAGKRVRQLSLLSGGERSLTALAFLFAIFEARPSPFYVMDEVEAALDDVNLTRLLGAFDRLREHAQLIVITHQQRTMGIADALYGVTMRADGVTAVISQRLDRSRERIADRK
ncbi:chromosome segregation protein SMC [Bifidobacterium sp. 82T24]|uniref:chromosome segregation protein SMC n=1 Tax=Bifidobacterium pluvialisilvae TaxID=2834436 RepID=UPI001C5709CC|nr:chromosome segregation protein SMC [Bifidobacterium pluvialisilvae]MBW3087290.1 chromosome segregation protein SMC [Bifidobacterium pluvialisilvae]